MIEDREQLKQEVVQAAIIHYQLEEAGRVYPVVQQLELERAERPDFTYKFAVLVAGRAALVYRDWEGRYKVEDDPERQLSEDEEEEREAYQVLITASHYLEVNLGRVASLQVEDVTGQVKDETARRSWSIWLDQAHCIVSRYDEATGPRYAASLPS